MSSFKRRIPSSASAPSSGSIRAKGPIPSSPHSGAQGTKPSIHLPGHTLTSTGVPSLDEVLGGGVPLGSILLLEEDYPTGYAKHLLKYWVSEGLAQGHQTLWVSADRGSDMVNELPAWQTQPTPSPPSKQPSAPTDTTGPGGKLKIAWRYQNLPKLDQPSPPPMPGGRSGLTPYHHVYDHLRPISKDVLQDKEGYLHFIDARSWSEEAEGMYQRLWLLITQAILHPNCPSNPDQKPIVTRIALDSIGSPSWGPEGQGLIPFLHRLASFIHASTGSSIACLISLPSHTLSLPTILRASHLSDAVLSLQAFGTHAGPTGPGGYAGRIRIHKAPTMGALRSASSKMGWMGADLAFKWGRRRGLTLERFSLPPEGGVGARRTRGEGDDPLAF
ncbi:MAG: Elongator complex protein 4 [Piptocephalis tieghemiana]|nr:MAG: Elongator complex protein 4 [Piptocephalis tieghemiana]